MGKKKGKSVKQSTVKVDKVANAAANVATNDAVGRAATAAGAASVQKAVAAATPAPTPKPLIIKVNKKDAVYRGARREWYARLLEFDGKTEGEYIQSTKDNPPALTRNQTAENPTGWVSWFKRQGIMSLTSAA